MSQTLYTIGYSGFAAGEFPGVLKAHGIRAVIDVRSSPYSRYFSDYNKEALERRLRQAGLLYRNYAEEFGARQEDRSFYSPQGWLDFERFSASPQFQRGMEKLYAGMARGYVFALLCAEKNPIDCHRTILVARAFARQGCGIRHLCPGGRVLTQEDIDRQLLDRYFPDRDQVTLFGGGAGEEESELLNRAYRKRNAEIGYRLEEES